MQEHTLRTSVFWHHQRLGFHSCRFVCVFVQPFSGLCLITKSISKRSQWNGAVWILFCQIPVLTCNKESSEPRRKATKERADFQHLLLHHRNPTPVWDVSACVWSCTYVHPMTLADWLNNEWKRKQEEESSRALQMWVRWASTLPSRFCAGRMQTDG